QGGHPRGAGRLPAPEPQTNRHRPPARGRAGTASVRAARSIPAAPRTTPPGGIEAEAGRGRPARLGPATAPALLGRGVRPYPPCPSPHAGAPASTAGGRGERPAGAV